MNNGFLRADILIIGYLPGGLNIALTEICLTVKRRYDFQVGK